MIYPNELFIMGDLLDQLIPNGEKEITINGVKYKVTKTDSEFAITPCFDDALVKEKINSFKEKLEMLPDDLFVKTVEQVEEEINIKEFDEFLKRTEFTEDEAKDIEEVINTISEAAQENIKEEVLRLKDLYTKFSR